MSGEDRTAASDRALEASYVLSVFEIEAGLKLAGKIRWSARKSAVQSALLGLSCLLFTYYAVLQPENRIYATVALLCAALAAAVWILPRVNGRNMAKRGYTGRRIELSVSPAARSMRVMPEGKEPWEIPLDGSLRAEENGLIFLVFLQNGQLLILPKRAFEKENLETLRALLWPEKDPDTGI